MRLSPTDTDHDQATHVYVHLANRGGGWVLLVEREGQIVASEHCTDWHRVERRRRLLEAGMVWHSARVAAAILAFAAALSAPPVFAQDSPSTVGSQVLWRDLTQIVYYGAGPDSAETAESDYRLQALNAVLYGTLRSNRTVSVTGRVGWLTRVGLSPSTGPFDRDLPDTVQGTTTFARVDVAKGHEGWRFEFRLNDPIRLARLKQHTAVVPFVP